jgi:hypothetical protein
MGRPQYKPVVEIEPATVVVEDSEHTGISAFTIELSEREAAVLTTEAHEIGGRSIAAESALALADE